MMCPPLPGTVSGYAENSVRKWLDVLSEDSYIKCRPGTRKLTIECVVSGVACRLRGCFQLELLEHASPVRAYRLYAQEQLICAGAVRFQCLEPDGALLYIM